MWPFKYPYTNFHELNLDWLINEVKSLKNQFDLLTRNNEIKQGSRFDYVLCVGDSYTAGAGAASGIGWPERLYPVIGAVRSYTLWNGGGGFSRDGHYGTMAQAVRAVDIPDPDKVTLVVCMAGINDVNEDSSLKTGVADFLAAVREKCPNAEIIGFASAAPFVSERSKYVSIGQGFTAGGCRFVNSWKWCLSVDDFYKSAEDNIHLNDNGYIHVAGKIAAALLGGDYEGPRRSKTTTSPEGVSVTIDSDDAGLCITAVGTLGSTVSSAVVSSVVGVGATPLRHVALGGVFGSLLNTSVNNVITYKQSMYLTESGAFAFPGSNVAGCSLNMQGMFVPWEALH